MNKDSTAPGSIRRDARPPIASDSAPRLGAVEGHGPGAVGTATPSPMRRTVWPRPVISPAVWEPTGPGYPVASRYVRTFWTAALGPGAVADLLRLATAAARGRSLRRPLNLSQLCAAGLARHRNGRVEVKVTIPPLSVTQLRAMSPAVRRLHANAYPYPEAVA